MSTDLLCVYHELVVAKASIDERIDERARQVTPRRVDRRAKQLLACLEMTLVDILQTPRLIHAELLSKVNEPLAQSRVVDAVDNLRVVNLLVGARLDPLDGHLLASEKHGELLAHHRVARRLEVGLDQVAVADAQGEDEGLGEAVVLAVDLVSGAEEADVVWRDEEVGAAG